MRKHIICLVLIKVLFFFLATVNSVSGQTESEKLMQTSINNFNESLYDEAICNANLALSLNKNTPVAYKVLCAAHYRLGDFEEAINFGRKALQFDPNDAFTQSNFQQAKKLAPKIKISQVSVFIIIFIILLVCFISFLGSRKNTFTVYKEQSLMPAILLSSLVTSFIYFIFFKSAIYIRSKNAITNSQDITPMLRGWLVERDGMEGYSLFLLCFVCLFLVLAVNFAFRLNYGRSFFNFLFAISVVVLVWLAYTVGFYPPLYVISELRNSVLLVSGLITAIVIIVFLYRKWPMVACFLIVVLLIPVCFIPVRIISVFDYGFILLPALKISQGFQLKDIYLQYDLFLSLLVFGWMKTGLDIYDFQQIGRISYFIWLAVLLFFTRRVFNSSWLAITLMFAVVIVRMYASMGNDIISEFQITPLRLDLWLLLILLIYFYGGFHWTLGLILGILLVVHKNFGMLYLAGYLVYVSIVFLSDLFDEKNVTFSLIKDKVIQFLMKIAPNVLLIAAGTGINIYLFGSFFPESAILYQKIGIGMIPISRLSFFWYILLMLCTLLFVLLKSRKAISKSYFNTGVFLITLSIANSMYFFGRSHEHNLINLAMIYLVDLFMLFDLLIFHYSNSKDSFKVKLVTAYPFVFLFISIFFYSERIVDKVGLQTENFKNGIFNVPVERPVDFTTIKDFTKGSDKLYFLSFNKDYQYYYYGKYRPEGYYSPFAAWVINKDMIFYFNDLLKKGYFFVIPLLEDDPNNIAVLNEIIPQLKFKNKVEKDGYLFISNN